MPALGAEQPPDPGRVRRPGVTTGTTGLERADPARGGRLDPLVDLPEQLAAHRGHLAGHQRPGHLPLGVLAQRGQRLAHQVLEPVQLGQAGPGRGHFVGTVPLDRREFVQARRGAHRGRPVDRGRGVVEHRGQRRAGPLRERRQAGKGLGGVLGGHRDLLQRVLGAGLNVVGVAHVRRDPVDSARTCAVRAGQQLGQRLPRHRGQHVGVGQRLHPGQGVPVGCADHVQHDGAGLAR